MIGASISRWMNANGSFLEGLGYCQQVNPAAYQLLERWKTAPIIPPEIKDKLRSALLAHAASAPQPAIPVKVSEYNPSEGGNDAVAPSLPEPPEIKELRRQARQLHKQYAELKARLGIMSEEPDKYTAADRYQLCREIMEDVLPATDDIYEQIRAYEDTGTLPTLGGNALRKQIVEMYDQVLSLRPRISRIRKWLAEGAWPRKGVTVPLSADDRQTLEQELEDKLATLEQLTTELGIDG